MGLPERAAESPFPAHARVLKVRLSLKGRPIKAYRFKQEAITVGRDPESDIFLDNPGVSRNHLQLRATSRGYFEVEDLGSANGTVLNDKPLGGTEFLMNNDVLRIGKFSLWVSYEQDNRGHSSAEHAAPSPTAFQGTTVLSTEELEQVVTGYRERAAAFSAPGAASPAPVPAAAGAGLSQATVAALLLVAFLFGTGIGAAATWYLAH